MTGDGAADGERGATGGGDRLGDGATAATGGDSETRMRESFPSPRRRQLLKSVAAPAAATALAGCSVLESGEDPLVEDLEPGDSVGYAGAFRFGDTYAVTVRNAADGTTTLAGRFRGEDRYLDFEGDESVETYLVDGDGYVVVDGACTVYPDLDAGLRSVGSVESPETGDAEPELTVTGTDEIDGTETLVLERDDADGGPTYYVDRETRRLRRVETDASVVDYREWGAVDRIEPPDADCREAPESATTPE
ncbi:hypothetical protein [Natronomonas marina]|jgi:hypothetical protein|uniref:hypothetical protein n=1 Tax=Natronomonas marina TaxID=2961939 RepID=UPI0020C94C85|nr:hypothetical protein [Natronomonas marina]